MYALLSKANIVWIVRFRAGTDVLARTPF